MKLAAAYIRVSTDMQIEYSPDSQIKLIKEYANKSMFIITEIYSDEGVSGRKADKRPAFKKMIADAKRKQFEVILIYNTSRFARNHEESIIYRNMLKREGIDVISITQPSIDYKTDILMNALYAVMDERYSIELSENVKRGMKEKVSRGKYISCAPLGYKRVERNKPLVIDDNESVLIRWIFSEYLNGKTMFAMARELNTKGYKAKRGNPFDRRGIFYILSNPIYKGFLSWTCDNETIYMKADHPAIIEEPVFEEVQRLLRENVRRKHYKGRESDACSHWLNGIIRCAACGTTYIFVKGYKGRSDRFRCGHYSNASCQNNHSIKTKVIEALVLGHLASIPIANLHFVKNNIQNELPPADDGIISKLEKALGRAKQAYLQGIDTLDEYKKNKEALTNEIALINISLSISKAESDNKKEIESKIRTLTDMLNSDKSIQSKNLMLRNVISKIIINPKTNELSFYFFS